MISDTKLEKYLNHSGLVQGPSELKARQKARIAGPGPCSWVVAIQIFTVLAQKKIFIIQHSQTAFGSELRTKPIFSWSKRSRWALLKLEARSAVDFLSV